MSRWLLLLVIVGSVVAIAWPNRRRLDPFDRLPRPLQLVSVAVAVILFAVAADFAITGDRLARQFFWPETVGSKVPEWKDLFQALLLLLGLPIALLIWHWRDRNAHHQIENTRADLSLREFQELQIRAAGGFEKKIPEGARVALQVASLHQLRPYLRGGYGTSFRLAAFELFCSMLEADMEKPAQARVSGAPAREGTVSGLVVPRRVYLALRDIVFEDWESFLLSGFSLAQRSLKNIRLPEGASLSEVDFRHADLSGASFANVTFIACVFDEATLNDLSAVSAKFHRCTFDKTSMLRANLEAAEFDDCRFEGVAAVSGRFGRSKIVATRLRGMDMASANFAGAAIEASDLFIAEGGDLDFDGAVIRRSALGVTNVSQIGVGSLTFDRFSMLSQGGDHSPAAAWSGSLERDLLHTEDGDREALLAPWLKVGARPITYRSEIREPSESQLQRQESQTFDQRKKDRVVRTLVTSILVAMTIAMLIVAANVRPGSGSRPTSATSNTTTE